MPTILERRSRRVARYLIAVPVILFVGYPLVWLILSSFKTSFEIFADPWGIPARFLFENWKQAWMVGNLGRFYINSIIVTATSVDQSSRTRR